MSEETKIGILKKIGINNPTNENSQYLPIVKIFILIMSILFFFIAYDRFTDFILVVILILTISSALSTKFDKWQITYLLYLVVAIILGIFFIELIDLLSPDANFFQTDADSARYLISSLIQSEAAIIAIVVTLSLVAVQQTSSTYSARVINIFTNPKRNPAFFILIISYLLCMVFSAFLLKVIISQSSKNTIVFSSIEISIWIACFLFIFLLFALIPYILKTLEMFKPSTLIKRLSENISKKSIELAIKQENLNNISRRGDIKLIDDTIQPIVDVLQGSMKSYDYETARYGLRIIESKAIQILKDESCHSKCKEVIANRIIDHIKTIGIHATKQEMERVVDDTADTFFSIFECLIEYEIYASVDALVSALLKIGEKTISENMESSTVHILKILNEIGIKSIDLDLNSLAVNIFASIGRITMVKIAMENSLFTHQTSISYVYKNATEYLETIGDKIAEKKWKNEILQLLNIFNIIEEALIENTVITKNAEFMLNNLLYILYSLSLSLIKNDLGKLVFRTTSMIYDFGIEISAKNYDLKLISSSLLRSLINDIYRLDPLETNMELNNNLTKHIEELLNKIGSFKSSVDEVY